jgi:hypothetical protein
MGIALTIFVTRVDLLSKLSGVFIYIGVFVFVFIGFFCVGISRAFFIITRMRGGL